MYVTHTDFSLGYLLVGIGGERPQLHDGADGPLAGFPHHGGAEAAGTVGGRNEPVPKWTVSVSIDVAHKL